MAQIHILDSETIDKIAAGEVVERPASVVKELVENAIDAGATAVTVEAKEGGIEFIRVTDDGCGMEREQIRTAFLRHATSKIADADDLTRISSLGFRGEALSSIAAVSRAEVITKTRESLSGTRILLEGAQEIGFEEVGAPEGTTFFVRNLFFNTPVRRKFLRQPATEGGYIADLMEHLALSRPDISFQLSLNGQLKFHTSGNGDLREVIYRIYGRDVANELVPVVLERDGIQLEGYLGKPVQVRSNRNFEIYFINGRFVRSNIIAKAIEEGYKEYLMQHKFPFCVLHVTMDPDRVDVNVHPQKMDVRFSDAIGFHVFLAESLRETLRRREMMPEATLSGERERKAARAAGQRERQAVPPAPQPFEQNRSASYRVMQESVYAADGAAYVPKSHLPEPARPDSQAAEEEFFTETSELPEDQGQKPPSGHVRPAAPPESPREPVVGVQMDLFEEKILTGDSRRRFRVIGQVFETYWLIEFEEKLLMVDQHAAHEKVHYERLMKQYREAKVLSQGLLPPVIVSLTGQEESVLKEHRDTFAALGFETESFGGSEYALRGVPADLYGCAAGEMFLEVLDGLRDGAGFGDIRVVEEKIASMSCKSAVKGNRKLSVPEAEALIDELLTLDNPYNCPHGRPTVIAMTKAEMDRKFKRIVS